MRYLRILETGRSVRFPRGDGMMVVVIVCPSAEQEKDDLRRELQHVRELLETNLGG